MANWHCLLSNSNSCCPIFMKRLCLWCKRLFSFQVMEKRNVYNIEHNFFIKKHFMCPDVDTPLWTRCIYYKQNITIFVCGAYYSLGTLDHYLNEYSTPWRITKMFKLYFHTHVVIQFGVVAQWIRCLSRSVDGASSVPRLVISIQSLLCVFSSCIYIFLE